MTKFKKRAILVVFDALIIVIASTISLYFLLPYITVPTLEFWTAIFMSIVIYYAFAAIYRLYDKINRYTSIRETILHMFGVTTAFLLATVLTVPFISGVSVRFMLLTYIFTVFAIPGSRVIWRVYHEHQHKLKLIDNPNVPKIRTLIVGAGDGGSLFIRSFHRHESDIQLVGIIDNDPIKQKMTLYGIPVIGKVADIPSLVKRHDVEQITIAIPSLIPKELEEIVEYCHEANVKVNQMPSIEEVVQGKLTVNKFRDIDVIDLLGREEVSLDMEAITDQVTGKVILISGAGGSIGSEICRQIIRFSPKKILLFGHGENSIYSIHKELKGIKSQDTELIPLIADVQDRERIFSIMNDYKPDQVYHAAAHKHVPLMEYNPTEAVKNNIYGTKNMAEAAKAVNVKNFVMISTDKAVNPPNVIGATKRVAEMIVTGLNETGQTNFVAVRFGNVLGSRGSVIPLFKEQIQNGGPITVTDFRMTRYFMTIPEASRLVLQAGALASGGEIFVLDMGEPVRIVDLAKKMVKLSGYTEQEIPIVEAGIRPGEKLYEELLATNESTEEKVFDKIFVGKVQNEAFENVMKFIRNLEKLSKEEVKISLIEFANGVHLDNIETQNEDTHYNEVLESTLLTST